MRPSGLSFLGLGSFLVAGSLLLGGASGQQDLTIQDAFLDPHEAASVAAQMPGKRTFCQDVDLPPSLYGRLMAALDLSFSSSSSSSSSSSRRAGASGVALVRTVTVWTGGVALWPRPLWECCTCPGMARWP